MIGSLTKVRFHANTPRHFERSGAIQPAGAHFGRALLQFGTDSHFGAITPDQGALAESPFEECNQPFSVGMEAPRYWPPDCKFPAAHKHPAENSSGVEAPWRVSRAA